MQFKRVFDAHALSEQDYVMRYGQHKVDQYLELLREYRALRQVTLEKGIVLFDSLESFALFNRTHIVCDDLVKGRRNLSKLVRKLVMVRNPKTGTVYQKTVWIRLLPKGKVILTEKLDSPDDEIVDIGDAPVDPDYPEGNFRGGDLVSFTALDENNQRFTGEGVVSSQSKAKEYKGKTVYIVKDADGISHRVSEDHLVLLGTEKQVQYFEAKRGDLRSVEYDLRGFPTDLNMLTPTGQSLGGSTGATLMSTPDGQRYVVKRGLNNITGGSSPGHATEEYYANRLYQLMGSDVPDVKLYPGGIFVSKFMPDTKDVASYMSAMPKKADDIKKQVQKNFVLDALFANWDVMQQNDNVRVDGKGRVVRVDNGGSLRYRAQGHLKGILWGDEVVEIDTMRKHNPEWFGDITDDQVARQVQRVVQTWRVQGIDGMLTAEKFPKELRKRLTARIESLVGWYDEYLATKDNDPNLPVSNVSSVEKLLSVNETVSDALPGGAVDERLGKVYAKWGDYYATHLHPTDVYKSTGWASLSVLSKLRGFNARPVIVEREDFDRLLSENSDDFYLCYRGVGDIGSDSFRQSKICFYGTSGVHGIGIYSTISTTNNNDYVKDTDVVKYGDYAFQNDSAVQEASGYGHNMHQILVSKKLRIGDVDDLQTEIQNLLNPNNEELTKLQELVIAAQDDFNTTFAVYDKARQEAIVKIKKDIGTFDMENLLNTPYKSDKTGTWATIQAFTAMASGKLEILPDDKFKIVLPTGATHVSTEQFHQVQSGFINYMRKSLRFFAGGKQRILERLADGPIGNFFRKEYIQKQDEVIASLLENNTTLQQLKSASDVKFKVLTDIQGDIESWQKSQGATKPSGMPDTIFQAMLSSPGSDRVGLYAMWRGYDAIRKIGGNNMGSDFMIILNRAKCLVRAKNSD